jgi:hypothetical protein
MKALLRLFSTVHALMAFLFACAALLLIAICDSDAAGEDLVYSQVRRMMALANRVHSLDMKSQHGTCNPVRNPGDLL